MLKRFVLASLMVMSVGQVQADSYTDRTAFESAISLGYKETFQSMTPGTYGITGPVALPSGLVVSSPTNDLFAVGVGQSSNPTQAIGSNYPPADYLTFALGGDYRAFGGDFFQNFGGGAQTGSPVTYLLSFFDDGNLVATLSGLVAPNGGSFIGYVGAGAFDTVQVFSQRDSFEVADNITVGNGDNRIPEPGTMALAALGVAALVMRRRNSRA